MKSKLLIMGLAVTLFASGSFGADHGRKLTVGAYIKSAKIEIISGDLERYKTATAMLDSLFMHHGYHAEGLFLMAQMQVDFMAAQANPTAKKPYVEAFVAYVDTLKWACDKDNKDVVQKNKKDCDNYIEKADSTKSKFWGEFYNAGVEQLRIVEENKKQLETETDSVAIEYIKSALEANADSCLTNLQLAIMLNPADHRAYIGAAQAFEHEGEFQKANDMMIEGLSHMSGPDRLQLLTPIAYNYVSMEDFCKAAEYLQEYVDSVGMADTSISGTVANLVICYNNCGAFDKAYEVNVKLLEMDPSNADALTNTVRYYNQLARDAADSVRHYRELDQTDLVATWTQRRNEMFDSSVVYARKAYDLRPDDPEAVENYALSSALREHYVEANEAYGKLVVLIPDDVKHWIALGDVRLYLKQFDSAIVAYEKAVELEPANKSIWQQLVDLYENEGLTKKKTTAEQKLRDLQ